MKNIVLILLFLTAASYAQWSINPLAICDEWQEQTLPKIASTSDGGTYVSWFDYREGNYALYLQRLDPLGYTMWTNNGLLISNKPQSPSLGDYDLIVDSDNNAVLVFTDIRNSWSLNVFAYKISPSGAFLWGANGVNLSSTSGNQKNPKIVQTNDGNFVVVWSIGVNPLIALQKLSPQGAKMWGDSPVLISSNEVYNHAQIVPTDSNGVLVLHTATTGNLTKLKATKVSSEGTVSWQMYLQDLGYILPWTVPKVYSDMNNGGIIAWNDNRYLNNLISSFVQRISSSGSLYFPVNGTEVSLTPGTSKYNPVASFDPSTNDTYVFWVEANSGNTLKGLSGQKVSPTGERMWTDNGKIFQPLNTLAIGDLSLKSKAGQVFSFYIEVQSAYVNIIKVFACDGTGNFLWPGNFVTHYNATAESQMVSTIDVYSNCKMAWRDYSSVVGTGINIYAQGINVNGELGNPIVPVELESFTAVSVNGNVILNWRTATEINNLGFEIERKLSNSEFEKIGFVEGKGTTTEKTSYSFTDQVSITGKIIYRLKQIDYDGTFSYSETAEVNISEDLSYKLDQNYPNPFNPTTKISFTIPEAGLVSLKIYNMIGQEIKTLVNGFREAGSYTVDFSAEDLFSGVYIYKIESGNFSQVRKMTLLK